MASDFVELSSGRTTALVRNDFLESFERHRLLDCARAPLLEVPGSASSAEISGGRGGIRVVPAGALGEAVVRPYVRGGLVERFNRRRYFFGERAFAELVATQRLRRRGGPVPEALAAVQSARSPGYLACLATRRIPRVRRAAVVLASAPGAVRAITLERIGRAVRSLHVAGGVHADLNAHNILVTEDGEGPGFVIDLDRATVLEGPVTGRRARANLERLRRSFRKLGLRDALREWEYLERGYEAPPRPPVAA
jgi:3-deoxy-D-manno-octulosonic acid kinase